MGNEGMRWGGEERRRKRKEREMKEGRREEWQEIVRERRERGIKQLFESNNLDITKR